MCNTVPAFSCRCRRLSASCAARDVHFARVANAVIRELYKMIFMTPDPGQRQKYQLMRPHACSSLESGKCGVHMTQDMGRPGPPHTKVKHVCGTCTRTHVLRVAILSLSYTLPKTRQSIATYNVL